MLATSIITDSKGSFLDAKNSRIIYKNDVGDLSPILCQLGGGFASPYYFVYATFLLLVRFFLYSWARWNGDAGWPLATGCIWPHWSKSSDLGCKFKCELPGSVSGPLCFQLDRIPGLGKPPRFQMGLLFR